MTAISTGSDGSGQDPDLPDALYRRARDLHEQFNATLDRTVAEEAIATCRETLTMLATDHPLRGHLLVQLAGSLYDLFMVNPDPGLVREGAERLSDALAIFPETASERVECLALRWVFVLVLYEFTADARWLDEAREVRAALDAAASADDEVVRLLTSLGVNGELWRLQHELTGDPESSHAAVTAQRAALNESAADDPYHAVQRYGLMMALLREYERTSDTELLVEAAEAGRRAVAAPPDDATELCLVRSGLAAVLTRLFERTADAALGREAIDHARAAVALPVPATHMHAHQAWQSLSVVLLTVGLHSGDAELLRQAVEAGRTAVDTAPRAHPNHGVALYNLGIVGHALYTQTLDLSTLREAITALRAGAASVTTGTQHAANCLVSLATSLREMNRRTGDPQALDDAVAAGRAAVATMPSSGHFRAYALSSLAAALEARYERDGDVEAGQELIMIRRAAVAATGDDHVFRGQFLENLSISLHVVFHETGDQQALREAVTTGRAAVAAVPSELPARARYRARLGDALRCLGEATGDPAALAEAVEVCAEVAATTSALPIHRIDAGRELVRMHLAAGRATAALAAAEEVVGLLPSVATRAMRRQDREFRLGQTMGLAAQVAAAALTAGQPRRALELAEETRGRLLAEAMESRDDLARIRACSTELAAEFERVEAEFTALDAAAHDDDPAVVATPGPAAPVAAAGETSRLAAAQELAKRRARTEADRAALVRRIRSDPRLAEFQRAPSVTRLQEAGIGPVVTLIADASRCDALILTADRAKPVLHVPLPDLTAGEVTSHVGRFRRARLSAQDDSASLRTQRNAQRAMLDILAWAWDAITEPVLATLGHTGTPPANSPHEWPRVWWCPTGTLAYLPLHAAGHHGDVAAGATHPRTVLDRVVSSYAPTIRSLGYARRTASGPAAGHETLIVAPAEAPGSMHLDKVAAEAGLVARLTPGSTIISGPTATREAVLAALAASRVVHFACHGVSDWTTPQSSRLLLAGHATAPLTIAEIAKCQHDADLAFLSACETTEAPARLADEVIHITSAFQLAGFRQVIGTLWPINDAAACDIAGRVYASLTQDGTRPADPDMAAVALHAAIRHYRGTWAPTRWAAHVHVGA